jgi:hypothetical protein
MTYEYEQYLAHHGIKGQKWGVRRYQNEDGSLTEDGKKKYLISENSRYKYIKKLGKESGKKDYDFTYEKAKNMFSDDFVKRNRESYARMKKAEEDYFKTSLSDKKNKNEKERRERETRAFYEQEIKREVSNFIGKNSGKKVTSFKAAGKKYKESVDDILTMALNAKIADDYWKNKKR